MDRKKVWHVFCIAPMNSDLQWSAKKAVLLSVCDELGWLPHIPKYDPASNRYSLAKDVTRLKESRLVLADLSYERPSCYFELGLAEALGRPVRPIAMAGTIIHQTSYKRNVRFYGSLKDYQACVRFALKPRRNVS